MQRAFVTGPTEPPICPKTFAQFIDEQAATYGQKHSFYGGLPTVLQNDICLIAKSAIQRLLWIKFPPRPHSLSVLKNTFVPSEGSPHP